MLLEIAAAGFRFGIVPFGADVVKVLSRRVFGAVVRVPRDFRPAWAACSDKLAARCFTFGPIFRPAMACISRLN